MPATLMSDRAVGVAQDCLAMLQDMLKHLLSWQVYHNVPADPIEWDCCVDILSSSNVDEVRQSIISNLKALPQPTLMLIGDCLPSQSMLPCQTFSFAGVGWLQRQRLSDSWYPYYSTCFPLRYEQYLCPVRSGHAASAPTLAGNAFPQSSAASFTSCFNT